MGNFLSRLERAQPIPPNGRVLECERCKTPAPVGYRCSWCFEYPELDKKYKFRSEASSRIRPVFSVTEVAAYYCQSCTDEEQDVVAVGPCSWCGKIHTEPKF